MDINILLLHPQKIFLFIWELLFMFFGQSCSVLTYSMFRFSCLTGIGRIKRESSDWTLVQGKHSTFCSVYSIAQKNIDIFMFIVLSFPVLWTLCTSLKRFILEARNLCLQSRDHLPEFNSKFTYILLSTVRSISLVQIRSKH